MPTHHKGTPKEIAALDVYIKLMRACDSVTARVHEVLPAPLSATQFGVLETLFHLGPLCQGELAAKLLKSTANLTLVVANLEKAGLVRRVRQKDDLRYFKISLTPQGRKFIARLFPQVAATIQNEVDVLSDEEKYELGRLLKKLGLRGRA
jgi:MarR family 2-MHQ and catechol resistance regulon transcriptional repressor